MTVVVNIEDVNDNSPAFQSRDQINIAEDESIGYPILLVAATDADRNNSIRYTITSGDPENKFSLNRDTGMLSTPVQSLLWPTNFAIILVFSYSRWMIHLLMVTRRSCIPSILKQVVQYGNNKNIVRAN